MQTTKENFKIIESIKALNAANETVKALNVANDSIKALIVTQ